MQCRSHNGRPYHGVPELVSVCDIKREEIQWVWPGRLPVGKLVMLAGDPGLGKSFLTMDIAARLSRGLALPDEPDLPGPSALDLEPSREIRDVVVLSAEDDAGDTICPRLQDAGADTAHVHILKSVRLGEQSDLIQLDRDAAALQAVLEQVQNPGLVIIDPITAYMGNTDANSNADVRRLLHMLSRLAEETRVCMLCVTHLNKSTQTKTQYRTIGSLAFTAAARLAWLIAKDPNNPDRRVMVPIKSNITGGAPGLSYRIVQREDTIGPTLEYQIDPSPLTLEDLDSASTTDQPGELDEAITWLREMLKDGARGAKELNEMAGEVGISKITLKRAKRRLGVVSKRVDGAADAGSWAWALPS